MNLVTASAADYQDLLLRLAPPSSAGLAFPRDPGTSWGLFCLAVGDELARIHQRVLDLIEEADPRTTTEMLAAWERNAGLSAVGLSVAQRRARLWARLIARGGQTPAYFIALGVPFGKTITITEIATADLFRVDVSAVEDALHEETARFWWTVDGSDLDAGLVALFEQLKPAHTNSVWNS